MEGNPTGEVTAVTWKLLGAAGTIAGAAVAWLVARLNKAEDEVRELHKARLADRDKFEAQTLVWLNQIRERKGVSP